jgi:hypothetical protein
MIIVRLIMFMYRYNATVKLSCVYKSELSINTNMIYHINCLLRLNVVSFCDLIPLCAVFTRYRLVLEFHHTEAYLL